jgi:hypothetical protein
LLIVTGTYPQINNREVLVNKLITRTLLALLMLAAPTGVAARDFFGGASPLPMYLTVDYGDLDASLARAGLGPLDDGVFLMGWSTYIYVHPSVRVGLMGAGGSHIGEGMTCNITRQAKVGLGFIGATGEYVFSFMKGDVAVGTMLGYGHADIELRQIMPGPIDWDGIWDVYQCEPALPGTFMNIMKGNFFAYQPFLRLKYKMTGWLSLQGSAGYLGAQVSSWKHRGDAEIGGEPTLDLGGFIFTIGPHIGF